VVERARSYRRRGSRAYIERTVGRSQDGRLGAATTFEVLASANSSEFPLTNNTAAWKAYALPASRNAGAFGKLRAACLRNCADLGCPRITPRFIQNAPGDSILSAAFDSVPASLMKVEIGVRFEPDTPRHGVFELRAESAVSKRRFDENAVLRQRGRELVRVLPR
jgi:hypothetical protein